MSVLWCRSVPACLNATDCLKKRRQQFQRRAVNYVNKEEEIMRLQQLTVAKIKEVQATGKKFSKDCDQDEVDLHVLENKDAAKREESCCLESAVLELKKEIAVETEGQQHLRVTKSKAETDKEKSRKELVKTHEVFLKAVAYYKKKLHIRLRFEESRLIILHFLKILTPGCDMCSLKLSHTDGKWSLLETDPVLPCGKDLANKLETTQDTQGFISHVRKLFMQLPGKKKVSKKSRVCSS